MKCSRRQPGVAYSQPKPKKWAFMKCSGRQPGGDYSQPKSKTLGLRSARANPAAFVWSLDLVRLGVSYSGLAPEHLPGAVREARLSPRLSVSYSGLAPGALPEPFVRRVFRLGWE